MQIYEGSIVMARRYFGNLSISVVYKGLVYDQDTYAASVSGDGVTWRGNVYAASSGFGPGIAYDSPKAYDQIAKSAVTFATTPDGSESTKERDIMSTLDDAANSGPNAGRFHRPKSGSVRNPPRGNPSSGGTADKHAATELVLFAENDEPLYRQQRRPIELNLVKKFKAGKYDRALAVKLWMYLMDSAAKKYAKEFASPSDWNKIFTPATRRMAAIEMRDAFEPEMRIMARKT